jgi:hypothetical protein
MICGTILVYSIEAQAGVIKGCDGKPYYFTKADWRSIRTIPANDMAITFTPNRRLALNVSKIF